MLLSLFFPFFLLALSLCDLTAVHAFLAEIKFRNKRKTASIAHVISEQLSRNAPKGAMKKPQEIPLSNTP